MTAPLDLPDEIVREAVPDDDIVLAYVTRGTMARYVEGVAAKNADFREELIACIEGLEEAGETISAVARAWREPSAAVVPIHAMPRKNALLRWWPVAAAAAFVLVAGAYHHEQQNEREAQRVEALRREEIAAQNARLAKLMADLKEQQEAMALAQSELTNARSDADRANAQAKLAAAQEQQKATMSSVSAVKAAAGPRSSAAKAACNCQPGDPLCSCL